MKIGVYVLSKNAKENYSRESFDIRQNAGILVVVDILVRSGYEVEYVSKVNAHKCDIVLFSVTSDCDWWPFIDERSQWQSGNYKVIVGGQGVLNVRPFLSHVDYFVLGRAEGVIDGLVASLDREEEFSHPSVICSDQFDVESIYVINQSDVYPHTITLAKSKQYTESMIGCNRRCLFCGYTWHRKHSGGDFRYGDLWTKNEDVEIALLNYASGQPVNLNKLRTTAIDGMSERLRRYVNKPITREILQHFLRELAVCEKPHQVKFYNIIGYPTETEEDWFEFLEDIELADKGLPKKDKQTSILLHSTPFRPMPATPMACEPMSYRNYRGEIGRVLGRGLKGNIFYQGKALWAVESMGTESLPTVIQSAIVLRGVENDGDNIVRLARSKKFAGANMLTKQKTLEKYFDVGRLFGEFEPDTLPTRYLKTYAKVEKMWRG